MIKGIFRRNTPLVNIIMGWGHLAQTPFVVLDTGFTGDLQITPQMAKELRLSLTTATKMRVADGRIIEVPTTLAFVEMEGVKKYVQVLISEGMALAGIDLLSKFHYKAIVDCEHKTVELEKAA